MGVRITQEQFEALQRGRKKRIDVTPAGSNADLESLLSNAPVAAHGVPPFDTPVRITYLSARHRLADPDGIQTKSATDGLVEAGILGSDTTKEVKAITSEQIKISKDETEYTLITIEEI